MTFRFEWNPRKAASNLSKHDVSFEEAASVFHDALALTFPDPIILWVSRDTSPSECLMLGVCWQ